MKKMIRIGNAGGFWGDDLDAMRRQLQGGPLDYLSIDFLAEITMSILRKQQLRNPSLGYVEDFVEQIRQNAGLIRDTGVRILTNAGGINPLECGRKVVQELSNLGIQLKVAVVQGDDLLNRLGDLHANGVSFRNMETGEDFGRVKNRVQSANAYIGLGPLVKALEAGADIVIAGRVTDTSITMAPMVYEFGWNPEDWDNIAAALVAGHIVECGAQTTGGNFTDWKQVASFHNMGYPVIEMHPDGNFVITKHPGTGGMVTVDTVREQLVYEMGDPAAYISPDVVADFRTVELEQEGADRVGVRGVKGYPSTPFLKVSMAYQDGYASSGSVIVSGPDAKSKAEVFADIFWNRLQVNFQKRNTAYQGYNSCHQSLVQHHEPNEILLTFSIYDHDPDHHERFARNIAPLILSGPPGVAATGGRPRMRSVLTYWPALIPKSHIHPTVTLLSPEGESERMYKLESQTGFEQSVLPSPSVFQTHDDVEIIKNPDEGVKMRLMDICLARSGDKGDTANIGLLARNERAYAYIRKYITAGFVKNLFSDICKGRVIRYEMDNLQGLNFLLEESLDGGGTRSLLADPQGKTLAQALLNTEIIVPPAFLNL